MSNVNVRHSQAAPPANRFRRLHSTSISPWRACHIMCRQYVHVRVHTTHRYDTVHNLGAFCAEVAGLAVYCICAQLPLWQKLIDVLFCCNRRKYLFGTQAFSLNRPSPPPPPPPRVSGSIMGCSDYYLYSPNSVRVCACTASILCAYTTPVYDRNR